MTSEDYAKMRLKPIIVWVDYGSEGWSPTGFDSVEDAINAILDGSLVGGGASLFVTRRIDLSAKESS